MPKKPLRIIIDTNLWISFAFKTPSPQLSMILDDEEVEILGSDELLEELRDVMNRPKIRARISNEQIQSFLELIELSLLKFSVTSKVNACRDPKDNFLLALAQDGKADILITGDKDLLSLVSFKKTKILSLSAFLSSRYPGGK